VRILGINCFSHDTAAWLLDDGRLTVRYERRADIPTAFLHLACALICARKLQSP
jgi:hypothetical protein